MFHSNRMPMNDGLKKLILTTFIVVVAMIITVGISHRVNEERYLYSYTDAALWQAVNGDTLWNIAEEISTPIHDLRRVVDDIRELNPEMGILRANDIIRVPIYESIDDERKEQYRNQSTIGTAFTPSPTHYYDENN